MLSFLGNKKNNLHHQFNAKRADKQASKFLGIYHPYMYMDKTSFCSAPPSHPLPTTLLAQVDSRPVLPFLPSRRSPLSPLLWIGASVGWATLARLDQTETKIFIGWLERCFPPQETSEFSCRNVFLCSIYDSFAQTFILNKLCPDS